MGFVEMALDPVEAAVSLNRCRLWTGRGDLKRDLQWGLIFFILCLYRVRPQTMGTEALQDLKADEVEGLEHGPLCLHS